MLRVIIFNLLIFLCYSQKCYSPKIEHIFSNCVPCGGGRRCISGESTCNNQGDYINFPLEFVAESCTHETTDIHYVDQGYIYDASNLINNSKPEILHFVDYFNPATSARIKHYNLIFTLDYNTGKITITDGTNTQECWSCFDTGNGRFEYDIEVSTSFYT